MGGEIELEYGCIKGKNEEELEIEPEWLQFNDDCFECNCCDDGPCIQTGVSE